MLDTSIRSVAHGIVWFPNDSAKRVSELMLHQCSALRSAYQATHLHGLKDNDVKKYVKKNYSKYLNARYVADACCLASGIIQENSIFGGKDLWYDMVAGKTTKEEWQQTRNQQLYSRGEKSHKGNPNIRIEGDKLLVNDPNEHGLWLEGFLYIPEKFKVDLVCYDARLIRIDNNKFNVIFTWAEPVPNPSPTVPGILGIDTNPDGCAVSELDGNGNLVRHYYDLEQRLQFARKEKRDYDIRELAIRIVNEAKRVRKPIALELLKFKKDGGGYKKFRRMKSNFTYRKILEAIKRRAMKEGVQVIEIEPAFTSVLGALKYQKMYSIPIHNAAAIVIGRRAMGFLEREDFNVSEVEVDVKPERKRKKKKSKNKKKTTVKAKKSSKKKTDKPFKTKQTMLNLEGRGVGLRLSKKSWSWLKNKFLKPKPAILTGSCLAVGSKLTIGHSTSQTVGESTSTTGRSGQGEILVGVRKDSKEEL
jgi:IS605 OrfB family transposase